MACSTFYVNNTHREIGRLRAQQLMMGQSLKGVLSGLSVYNMAGYSLATIPLCLVFHDSCCPKMVFIVSLLLTLSPLDRTQK